MIGGGVGMLFQTGGKCDEGVNGNWQVWVRYCGGEAVCIHTVRKEAASFSSDKSITFSTLKFVD